MRLIFASRLSIAAFAQESASITRKISDPFREPVSGASIKATGAVYKAASKATSEYALDGLGLQ
jgi:hypothetical protein